jgi:hypothetical protein
VEFGFKLEFESLSGVGSAGLAAVSTNEDSVDFGGFLSVRERSDNAQSERGVMK